MIEFIAVTSMLVLGQVGINYVSNKFDENYTHSTFIDPREMDHIDLTDTSDTQAE